MKLSKLKIRGYKSFGPQETTIALVNNLAAFIGLNSAGKTTALEALKKMFGSSLNEREISRHDFHIGKDEDPDAITERELSIEVTINFSKQEEDAVPHFFSEMVVDHSGGDPYLRIRLEATWKKNGLTPDGDIDVKTYFINVAEGEEEQEDNKNIFPKHYRNLIQILYVPAIRKPAEQLKYVSGSMLFRVLKKIEWTDAFKQNFDSKIDEINTAFKGLPEFNIVQDSITEFWQKFHKDERYKDTNLGFGGSDFDSILKKLEIAFSPTGTHKVFGIDDLGDGYRSMFYLTLVCALLDIEEKLGVDPETIGITRPLLTILAIEEPENHIAPQLLGRVIKILLTISEKENSQVLLSSHTPAIIKRISPESIIHFRITDKYETSVSQILLPEKGDDAYKYVKEAVQNYPEIYFARLVVIGEGDSEEVIFNRLMSVLNTDFDDNIITFAPLGHRFVNHIWKLLKALNIPYITLLDLDVERDGGGWGRIKYVVKQLIKTGEDKGDLLLLDDNTVMSDNDLDIMHKRLLENAQHRKNLLSWVKYLKNFDVFYSAPLDLDFLMLKHYPDFYKKAVPSGGGPRIPDKSKALQEFEAKVESAVRASLKSEDAKGLNYTDEQKELMIWYNYHFLGRGKPTTHLQVLSEMKDSEIKDNLPVIFKEIFERISYTLNLNK